MESSEFINVLLGRRDFYSKNGIIKFVKNSKNYDSDKEDLDQADALKIFETSKQRTWLVSTNKRLYNILDDNRKNKPHINWSIPKRNIITDNKISLDIITHDYSEKSGLVDIGSKHEGWFYSKNLFNKSNIKKEIQNLIKRTMLTG